MSQMVLPQNLSSHSPSEASSASAPSRTGGEKSGDSQFDTVSRAEQKRLDAKRARDSKDASDAKDAQQADRNRQADNADKADKARVKAERPDAQQRPDSREGEPVSKEARQSLAADESDTGKEVAVADPLLEFDNDDLSATAVSAPLTFAGLQSLVTSAQPQAPANGTGMPANAQGLPFQGSMMMSVPGMNGGGKTGSMALQAAGQGNSSSGMALTETLLAGVTADGSKAAESPMLQNAIRFQGALESVNAQANAVNTPKMAPDAPILRGYTTSIDVPVSHAEWGDKMAGKLTWLTARNMSVAEIHLTPPDMGPMEVKVQVQQEQASITVHSANPVVREQLELHSHRLRDMLGEQGISLEQFDVSDSNRGQAGDGDAEAQAEGGSQSGDGIFADADSDDAGSQVGSLDLRWKGEVDIFA